MDVAPRLTLLAACLLATGVLVSSSVAAPRYVFRDMAFVTIVGHGSVTSAPHGIHCPRVCRAVWVRGTHVSFAAAPAPGWQLKGFKSTWCGTGFRSTCGFDLVSPHECAGGQCPIGAFGVRVIFTRKPSD